MKTLGYEVVATMSQKRDEIGGGTVLGKGRLEELAAITGGTGVVGSMAIPQKSKARERFEDADQKKPDAPQIEPDPDAPPKPEFVIVDHEISPSQARNLERATGAQVLDRTGVIMEIFRRHAHSREAKLQVEIARLKYVSPRLRESLAGGGRQQGPGAGESDLDLDRREDPRSPRRAERAAGGYSARQRPASVRASRSAPGRAGRVYERREVVAHACAHRQRGAGRGRALRDA